jgi:hypothetical protein
MLHLLLPFVAQASAEQDSPALAVAFIIALVGSVLLGAHVARGQGLPRWVGAVFGLFGVPGWIVFVMVLGVRRML